MNDQKHPGGRANPRFAVLAAISLSVSIPAMAATGSGGEADATSGNTAAASGTRGVLSEVVVTASKRTENVQTVPAAVSVITGSAIAQQGLTQFSDYVGLVPNVAQDNTGAPGHGQVIIRGLSSGHQQTGATVSFLIDGIPFTANTSAGDPALVAADPDLTDVERIEVLKGPQGTLYGASSLGGIIKIVSVQPEMDRFSADASAAFSSVQGGGAGYGVRGTVNVPISTDLAGLRLSAYQRVDPGFMTNVETGIQNINRTTVSGGKLLLKLTPLPDLDIELEGLMQDLSTPGGAQVETNSRTLVPLYCAYCYAAPEGWSFDTRYRIAGLTVNWKMAGGTLTNVLSYGHYSDSELTENIGFGFINQKFHLPPTVAAMASPSPEMTKVTDELRFAMNRIGNFESMAGLYFTNERTRYDVGLTNVDSVTLAPVAPPFANVLQANTLPTYKEYAAFLNLTYYFASNLDFTAGARGSHDEQSATTDSSGLLIGTPTHTTFSSSESPVTYLATLRYRPAENVDTYVRFATGYRPGGPQLTAGPGIPKSFAPDKTKNYAIGEKSRWLDGRLMANFDVYYIDWNDIQVTEAAPNGLNFTGNGGNAHSSGAEMDLAVRPIPALTARLSAAYNHAYSTVAVPEVGAKAGDTLPFSPHLTASALADYTFPISGQMNGDFGATFSYQGNRPTAFSGDLLNPIARLPGYGTLNLRLGAAWGDYSLQLRVDNATDKYAYSSSSVMNLFPGQGVPAESVVITPRTYGIEISGKW